MVVTDDSSAATLSGVRHSRPSAVLKATVPSLAPSYPHTDASFCVFVSMLFPSTVIIDERTPIARYRRLPLAVRVTRASERDGSFT